MNFKRKSPAEKHGKLIPGKLAVSVHQLQLIFFKLSAVTNPQTSEPPLWSHYLTMQFVISSDHRARPLNKKSGLSTTTFTPQQGQSGKTLTSNHCYHKTSKAPVKCWYFSNTLCRTHYTSNQYLFHGIPCVHTWPYKRPSVGL